MKEQEYEQINHPNGVTTWKTKPKEQPEALRLADEIEWIAAGKAGKETAAELRRLYWEELRVREHRDQMCAEVTRLHALNQEFLEALEVLGWQPTEEAMDYRDNAIDAIHKALASQPAQQQEPVAITAEQAYEMGANGAEPTNEERLLFEAWMRGHCWAVVGEWDGKTYVHKQESTGFVNASARLTRQLWAAWRDRAALTSPPANANAGKPWVGLTSEEKKEIERLSIYVEGAIRHTEAKLREKNYG